MMCEPKEISIVVPSGGYCASSCLSSSSFIFPSPSSSADYLNAEQTRHDSEYTSSSASNPRLLSPRSVATAWSSHLFSDELSQSPPAPSSSLVSVLQPSQTEPSLSPPAPSSSLVSVLQPSQTEPSLSPPAPSSSLVSVLQPSPTELSLSPPAPSSSLVSVLQPSPTELQPAPQDSLTTVSSSSSSNSLAFYQGQAQCPQSGAALHQSLQKVLYPRTKSPDDTSSVYIDAFNVNRPKLHDLSAHTQKQQNADQPEHRQRLVFQGTAVHKLSGAPLRSQSSAFRTPKAQPGQQPRSSDFQKASASSVEFCREDPKHLGSSFHTLKASRSMPSNQAEESRCKNVNRSGFVTETPAHESQKEDSAETSATCSNTPLTETSPVHRNCTVQRQMASRFVDGPCRNTSSAEDPDTRTVGQCYLQCLSGSNDFRPCFRAVTLGNKSRKKVAAAVVSRGRGHSSFVSFLEHCRARQNSALDKSDEAQRDRGHSLAGPRYAPIRGGGHFSKRPMPTRARSFDTVLMEHPVKQTPSAAAATGSLNDYVYNLDSKQESQWQNKSKTLARMFPEIETSVQTPEPGISGEQLCNQLFATYGWGFGRLPLKQIAPKASTSDEDVKTGTSPVTSPLHITLLQSPKPTQQSSEPTHTTENAESSVHKEVFLTESAMADPAELKYTPNFAKRFLAHRKWECKWVSSKLATANKDIKPEASPSPNRMGTARSIKNRHAFDSKLWTKGKDTPEALLQKQEAGCPNVNKDTRAKLKGGSLHNTPELLCSGKACEQPDVKQKEKGKRPGLVTRKLVPYLERVLDEGHSPSFTDIPYAVDDGERDLSTASTHVLNCQEANFAPTHLDDLVRIVPYSTQHDQEDAAFTDLVDQIENETLVKNCKHNAATAFDKRPDSTSKVLVRSEIDVCKVSEAKVPEYAETLNGKDLNSQEANFALTRTVALTRHGQQDAACKDHVDQIQNKTLVKYCKHNAAAAFDKRTKVLDRSGIDVCKSSKAKVPRHTETVQSKVFHHGHRIYKCSPGDTVSMPLAVRGTRKDFVNKFVPRETLSERRIQKPQQTKPPVFTIKSRFCESSPCKKGAECSSPEAKASQTQLAIKPAQKSSAARASQDSAPMKTGCFRRKRKGKGKGKGKSKSKGGQIKPTIQSIKLKLINSPFSLPTTKKQTAGQLIRMASIEVKGHHVASVERASSGSAAPPKGNQSNSVSTSKRSVRHSTSLSYKRANAAADTRVKRAVFGTNLSSGSAHGRLEAGDGKHRQTLFELRTKGRGTNNQEVVSISRITNTTQSKNDDEDDNSENENGANKKDEEEEDDKEEEEEESEEEEDDKDLSDEEKSYSDDDYDDGDVEEARGAEEPGEDMMTKPLTVSMMRQYCRQVGQRPVVTKRMARAICTWNKHGYDMFSRRIKNWARLPYRTRSCTPSVNQK